MRLLNAQDILLEVARVLHAEDFGGHHRLKWAKTKWEDMPQEGILEYVHKAEPTIRAVFEAGFVILPQSEVRQAWIPRREVELIRPKVTLSGKINIGRE